MIWATVNSTAKALWNIKADKKKTLENININI